MNNPVFGVWLRNQKEKEAMPERKTILSKIHKHLVGSGNICTGQNHKRKPAQPASSVCGCQGPVDNEESIASENKSNLVKQNLANQPAKAEIPSHMIGPNDTKCFDLFEHAFSKTYLCGN